MAGARRAFGSISRTTYPKRVTGRSGALPSADTRHKRTNSGETIMATLAKVILSGLIATSALAVVGTSASMASRPTNLRIQAQVVRASQATDNAQLIHKTLWREDDQRAFWEQQQDR